MDFFNIQKDAKYKYNQSIVKVFGYGENKKIKILTFKCLRTAGLEGEDDNFSSRCLVNDEKLCENISRAKCKIFELAFCNPWEYFFTGTLNPALYDRTDLEKFHFDLTQWIRNQGKRLNSKIDFLFIPELHADGKSWHIHGFINGLPPSELRQYVLGDKMGKSLAQKVLSGDVVYDWFRYSKKFGFCDLEPIRNPEAVSKYITKYINKNLASSVQELNAHLYYHSRGLHFAETIKRGAMEGVSITPDYVNDYCSVSWVDYSPETLEQLLKSFCD